jgi:hypothetical protein
MKPRSDQPRLVPTRLAAMAAGVSEAAIRKWASRGKITRYGTSRRALYDLEELLDLDELLAAENLGETDQ